MEYRAFLYAWNLGKMIRISGEKKCTMSRNQVNLSKISLFFEIWTNRVEDINGAKDDAMQGKRGMI